jgi:predicted DNA-binding protein (MmcQ/YjbR family)
MACDLATNEPGVLDPRGVCDARGERGPGRSASGTLDAATGTTTALRKYRVPVMKVDDVVQYCLAKLGAEETYPWGDAELVAKVGGKAFAFIGLTDDTVGVKCGVNSDEAGEWRERYPEDITASAYVGRYGWNRVRLDGNVPDDEVIELVDISYEAVVAKLPKSKRPS